MRTITELLQKNSHLVIGLMSGTCTDGIDAALVHITGCGVNTKAKLIDFLTIPYSQEIRDTLLKIAGGNYGGSYEISKANFLLGELSAEACLMLCKKAKIESTKVDYIGSHGHTIYHQPLSETYLGYPVTSTLQIGEAAVIAETMGCPVIADFRVRDMAAGGLGAPLVPYTEYLLYGGTGKNVALQNIGGIGNVTFLPSNGSTDDIIAFDTGPGNMVIDALISYYTANQKNYDKNGSIAASGKTDEELLNWLLQDTYIMKKPPKTTGREQYGKDFINQIIEKIKFYNIKMEDAIATVTMFTAIAIERNIKEYLPAMPEDIIIGGGGSKNITLINYIRELLPQCNVITNEDLGQNSDAKEAVAFAVLANETMHGICNNIPSATGAKHSVVMGKVTF